MTKPDQAPSIESADASARHLYRRARNAGTEFVDLAIAIHDLQISLRHLNVETQDPDSPLYAQPSPTSSRHDNSSSNSNNSDSNRGPPTTVYARQLRSLAEDSDFALKQVNTVLERHGDAVGTAPARRGPVPAATVQRINLIRGDLVSQALKIGIFLDTVQLHNPAKQGAGKPAMAAAENAPVNAGHVEEIKNKLDLVANRVFRERTAGQGEDELWRSFKMELGREGFAPDVLRQNKVGFTVPLLQTALGVHIAQRTASDPAS